MQEIVFLLMARLIKITAITILYSYTRYSKIFSIDVFQFYSCTGLLYIVHEIYHIDLVILLA